jgi:hypothetical protein
LLETWVVLYEILKRGSQVAWALGKSLVRVIQYASDGPED